MKISSFTVDDEVFTVFDDIDRKSVRSKSYNTDFDKKTGFFARYGKNKEDDPDYAPSPEIADIEITTICYGVPGNNGDNGNIGKRSPCSFCSPKGEKINTPFGVADIEKISKDDLVIGYNIKENRIAIQKVLETYKRHYKGKLVCIELDNGKIVKLTPEHIIILNYGKEIMAKDLKSSDEIINF